MSSLANTSYPAPGWQQEAAELLADVGFFTVTNAVPPDLISRCVTGAYEARDRIRSDVGAQKIDRALERGDNAIRLPFCYDAVFLELLELDAVLESLEIGLDRAAIVRFMNAAILPPTDTQHRSLSQNEWHRNFREHPAGDRLTIEVVVILTEQEDSPLLAVPGTHRRPGTPPESYLERHAVPARCPAGSLLVMDSRLFHRELPNGGSSDNVYVVMQLARHYIKAHFDHYVAMGPDRIGSLPERTRYLLGERTRLPTCLDEFYVPDEQRLYRPRSG